LREDLTGCLTDTFGAPAHGTLAVVSPGRVNLIGEHTDYNDGFVLPMALRRVVRLAGAPNGSDRVRIHSLNFAATCEARLDALNDGFTESWAGYTLGVAAALRDAGYDFAGFDAVVDSDVPVGAGLSSSAAVEVAIGVFLNECFSLGLTRLDLARVCQAAEHRYAGVKCGIMDQYTALFGKEGNALLLDCRALEHEYVPLPTDGYGFVVIDCGVRHELAASQYNARRQGCAEAVGKIARAVPGVTALRDVDEGCLETAKGALSDEEYRLARHVTGENARVLSAAEALKACDAVRFGELMYASHESLRDDYRVSCAELDALVESARAEDEVLGARMTGGGFGGATVNLVRTGCPETVAERIVLRYKDLTGQQAAFHIVGAGGGACTRTVE